MTLIWILVALLVLGGAAAWIWPGMPGSERQTRNRKIIEDYLDRRSRSRRPSQRSFSP